MCAAAMARSRDEIDPNLYDKITRGKEPITERPACWSARHNGCAITRGPFPER